MEYVEAPDTYRSEEPSVFLAGGITGCPDWQSRMVDMLEDTSLVLYTPRREDFPIEDPGAAEEQIRWEHEYLREADAISFWFPKDSVCPIALYEIGAWSMTDKPLFVGTHPEYPRKQDVEIQTGLARPDLDVAYSLEDVVDEVKRWEP
jgi:hypothetical protein